MEIPRNQVLNGDSRALLGALPENSVHCVVTSPPYFGLRDYGTEGQIGLEGSLDDYIDTIVGVFTGVHRVLREDGTLWLNLGDAYSKRVQHPLKMKDLYGLPWRVVLALQEWGWYLRSPIIWDKPNAMPESVLDRPTLSYEYVFLLTKSPNYYYDAWPLREGHNLKNPAGRQGRAIWRVPTISGKASHDAIMAPELALRCIKAGTSEHGACMRCGTPWKRRLKTEGSIPQTARRIQLAQSSSGEGSARLSQKGGTRQSTLGAGSGGDVPNRRVSSVGWDPGCKCGDGVEPCVVLDPFAGSGTTLLEAAGWGLDFVGFELNPAYVEEIRPLLEAAIEDRDARRGMAEVLGL